MDPVIGRNVWDRIRAHSWKLAGGVVAGVLLVGCGGGGGGGGTVFMIGGTVAGLGNGDTLVLQNNGTDRLSLTANGTFQFANPVSTYNVTVRSQPTQTRCTVTNGSGTATAAVSSVAVNCAPPTAPSNVALQQLTSLNVGQLNASWQAATDAQTQPSDLVYRLHISTNPSFTPDSSTQVLVDTGANLFRTGAVYATAIAQLTPGANYTAILQVVNGSGLSSFSRPVTVTVIRQPQLMQDNRSLTVGDTLNLWIGQAWDLIQQVVYTIGNSIVTVTRTGTDTFTQAFTYAYQVVASGTSNISASFYDASNHQIGISDHAGYSASCPAGQGFGTVAMQCVNLPPAPAINKAEMGADGVVTVVVTADASSTQVQVTWPASSPYYNPGQTSAPVQTVALDATTHQAILRHTQIGNTGVESQKFPFPIDGSVIQALAINDGGQSPVASSTLQMARPTVNVLPTYSTRCFGSNPNDALVSCSDPSAVALSGPGKQDGMLPPPQLVTPRYSTVGTHLITECVKDNQTGLMWEGKPTTGARAYNKAYTYIGVQNGYTNPVTGAVLSGLDATYTPLNQYISQVNASNLCGHNDWRLPTPDELKTIADFSQNISFGGNSVSPGSVFINLAWFPNTAAGSALGSNAVFGFNTYWTSVTGINTSTSDPSGGFIGQGATAMTVSFSYLWTEGSYTVDDTTYASAFINGRKVPEYYARLVRTGP